MSIDGLCKLRLFQSNWVLRHLYHIVSSPDYMLLVRFPSAGTIALAFVPACHTETHVELSEKLQ